MVDEQLRTLPTAVVAWPIVTGLFTSAAKADSEERTADSQPGKIEAKHADPIRYPRPRYSRCLSLVHLK
jgi:hypothetical protein